MKITKQKLKEIIKEELSEIDVQSQEETPERLLRREIRESKRALAAAIKQFVILQNYNLTGHEEPTMSTEPGPGMLRKFVDNWIQEWG
jgi:hypothetical protein